MTKNIKKENAKLRSALKAIMEEARPGQQLDIHEAINQLAGCYQIASLALDR